MMTGTGETSAGTAESTGRAGGHAILIGGSLAAALIFFYFLSTQAGGGDGEALPQAAVVDSIGLEDTIPGHAVLVETGDLPVLWTQARSSASANAAWGIPVEGPFEEIWKLTSSGGREFFSSPALVDDILYIGCNDGIMRAVDAQDGRVIWSFQTTCGICGEPSVDSTAVYFGGQDGSVYALDRLTGERLWSAGLGYHIFCDTGLLRDTLLITGNSMGKVCALDISDGDPVWSGDLGGLVLGPVLIGDSLCAFTTENGKVAVYSAAGEPVWTVSFRGQASPPSSDGVSLFAGFSTGMVRRISLDDGGVRWETDIVPADTRCVLSRPLLVDTLLLIGTCDGRLACLDSGTGQALWETSFENWLQLPPVAVGSIVYAACDDQRLHLLDLGSGAKLDSLEIGGYAGTAPVLAGGRLYLGTANGDLFAFQGTVPQPPDSLPPRSDR